MKEFLLACLLVLTTVGAAQAQDTAPPADDGLLYAGLVEAWGGFTFSEDRENSAIDDPFYPTIGGSGRANVPFSNSFSGQLDVDGEENLLNGDDFNETYGGALWTTGHLSLRNPTSHLIGGFAGVGVSHANDDEDSADFYVVGGEGQFYLGNFTLYGQGGYFNSQLDGDNEGIEDAFFARTVARAFLGARTRFELEGTFAVGDIDPKNSDDDTDVMFAWGARLDQQLPPIGGANLPIAAFVGYRGTFAENEDQNRSYDDHTVMLGLRFQFGAPSLLDNDRRGATLDSPWAIPRWVGYSLDVIDEGDL